MRAAIVLALLAVTAVAPGSAATRPQVWNGRIAFTDVTGIASVNPDGSGQWGVELGVGDTSPAWAPDGSHLAVAARFGGRSGIVVMDPDGSNGLRLTSDPSDSHSVWSPDGRKLAFDRDGQIWTIGAEGAGAIQLTRDAPAADQNPTWSPDGRQIAFDSWRVTGNHVYALDLASGHERQLTTDLSYSFDPAWSPDGSRIAFTSYRDGYAHLWLMNPDGTAETRLTDGAAYDSEPAWAPDGRQLAFARNSQIWVVDRDGQGIHQLTTGDGNSTPAWQPLGPPPGACDLWGTRADDLLVASDAGQILCGGNGNDTMIGGGGNDVLLGDDGNDYLAGAQGRDVLGGGAGDDVLDARDGHADAVVGGTGNDVAYVDRGLDEGTGARAYLSRDVAVWRPTTASAAEPTNPSVLAVDGRLDDWWNSGGNPSQWLEVDLQRPTDIARVRLVGTEQPEGAVFLVLGKGPATHGAYRLLHEFKGPSVDGQELIYAPKRAWKRIRYVRVVNPAVSAPTAWRELAVFAASRSGR